MLDRDASIKEFKFNQEIGFALTSVIRFSNFILGK